MSAWRKEASTRLPELQRVIASQHVDNPMRLWIELSIEFERLCEATPVALDLIRRIWRYADWCLHQGEGVFTAAAFGFCEHLLDSEASRRIVPQIMSKYEYEQLKELLLYHNSVEVYEKVLKSFEKVRKD